MVLLGTPINSSYNHLKILTKSNGFTKDILQFLKIGDECITLSAYELQKLISFVHLEYCFRMYLRLGLLFQYNFEIVECVFKQSSMHFAFPTL